MRITREAEQKNPVLGYISKQREGLGYQQNNICGGGMNSISGLGPRSRGFGSEFTVLFLGVMKTYSESPV